MDSIKLTKRNASTISEVVDMALEHIPMTFSNSDMFPGRKVFFPIPMKKNPKDSADFLYVYAESKLSGAPKNQRTGFTEQDVTDEVGIYLFKKNGEIISGRTYPMDTFLLEVMTDLSLRNRMIYRVNDMRKMVHLDESFLELANIEYKKADHFGARLH